MQKIGYVDYSIVIESEAPESAEKDFELLEVNDKNSSNFLRFRTCLQTFGIRNFNGRLWLPWHIREMLKTCRIYKKMEDGVWVGEDGHPIPPTGELSMARILTIDPDRTCHRIIKLDWENENKLCGIVETLDDGVGGHGYKFMKNILQGIKPAFSLRSIVPQRKNRDGTIDVLGPGKLVCYDRVYNPSHEEAVIDISVPVQNVISKSKFEHVLESFTSFAMESSENVQMVLDGMDPDLASASMDSTGMLSVNTKQGRIIMAPERKFRREFSHIMKNL